MPPICLGNGLAFAFYTSTDPRSPSCAGAPARPALQAALQAVGLPAGKLYLRDLFSQYDRNADGEVTFDEFRRCVGAAPVFSCRYV